MNNTVNMATEYNTFYLKSGDYLLIPSVFMHGRVCFETNQICAGNVGPDEDHPGGSSGKSHHPSESGQIRSGPIEVE